MQHPVNRVVTFAGAVPYNYLGLHQCCRSSECSVLRFIDPDFATKTLSLISMMTINNPNLEDSFSLGLNDRYQSVIVTSSASSGSTLRGGAASRWRIATGPLHECRTGLHFVIECLPHPEVRGNDSEGCEKTQRAPCRSGSHEELCFWHCRIISLWFRVGCHMNARC